jgi:hypothetical protein
MHQMILKLEQAGLITRQPEVARSIALTLDPKLLLEHNPRRNQQCAEVLGTPGGVGCGTVRSGPVR